MSQKALFATGKNMQQCNTESARNGIDSLARRTNFDDTCEQRLEQIHNARKQLLRQLVNTSLMFFSLHVYNRSVTLNFIHV